MLVNEEGKIDFKQLLKKDAKKGRSELAKFLVKKYKIFCSGKKNIEMYIYNGKTYNRGENQIKQEITNIIDEQATNNNVNEIYNYIQRIAFNQNITENIDPYLIPLENGILNIKDKIIIDYSPDFPFFSFLPVKYNPDLKCDKTLKVLSNMVDEDNLNLLQEWFGFNLFRKYFIKKALIITGDTDTGKTTIVRILISIIGKNNIADVSLQKLGINDFATYSLLNKYSNIHDELAYQDIKSNDAFKMVTGASVISGEQKFCDPIIFTNFAKMTFACNQIPLIKEVSDNAFFSRWMIITLTKQFPQNGMFLDDIITEDEKSGILNWALEGLERLLKHNKFGMKNTSEETKRIMLRNASSIAAFAYDILEEGDSNNDAITREDLYLNYQKYCYEFKLKKETKEMFGRHISNFAKYMLEGYVSSNRAWRGVKIKGQDSTPISHPSDLDADLAQYYSNDVEGVFR